MPLKLTTLNTTAAAEDGAVLHLLDPAHGTPLFDGETQEPVTLTLRGADSQTYRDVQRRQQQRRLDAMQRRGAMATPKAEEIENDLIETLVAVTVGWTALDLDGSGAVTPCTPAAARTLYVEHPWIREQAAAFITERSHFLRRGAHGAG